MDNTWPEIFMVESAAIIIGNVLTIAVLSNKRFLKKRGNWLILNLAVADLLVGAISEPLYIATIKGAIQDVARVYTSLDILLGMASVFGLAVLALDRLFAISWPFKHRTVSNTPYICSIIGIWLIAGIVAGISSVIKTNRTVVFFYILLPLLTISQVIMISSYVAIWIIVTTKRPKSIKRRRRHGSSLSTSSSLPIEHHHDNQEEPCSGSVRNICNAFDYDDVYHERTSGEETGSVRNIHDLSFDLTKNVPLSKNHLIAINKRKLQVGKMTECVINCNTSTEEKPFHIKNSCRRFKSDCRRPFIHKEKRMSLKRLRNLRNRVRQSRESMDRDNRLALTLFMVTAISLLAWLPFEIMNIVLSLCKTCRVKLYNIHVLSLTKLLHYANSLVNPIIYTFRMREFRSAMNSVLTLKCLKKRHHKLRSAYTEQNGTGYSWRVKSAIVVTTDRVL